jgi:hypothetical protein
MLPWIRNEPFSGYGLLSIVARLLFIMSIITHVEGSHMFNPD